MPLYFRRNTFADVRTGARLLELALASVNWNSTGSKQIHELIMFG